MAYDRACYQIGYSNWDIKEDLFSSFITPKEAEDLQFKLGDLYVNIILNGSDRTLKAILDANDVGICRRTEFTLNAIKTELLERVLYENSSEKDR